MFKVILIALFCAPAFAATNIEGTFTGKGNWFTNKTGEHFAYPVIYKIDGNQFSSHLGSADGGFDVVFQYKIDKNHRVVLTHNNKPAGTGYCLIESCHFDIDFLDETIGTYKATTNFVWNGKHLVVNGENLNTGFIFEDIVDKN